MSKYSESTLIEQPTIELFASLGWQTQSCYNEICGPNNPLGRETKHDIVLTTRLRAALTKLNPTLPPTAIDQAVAELSKDRSANHPVHANHDLWDLLRDGVKVTVHDQRGREQVELVRVIDWQNPTNNDFFLASQMWVAGDPYTKRPDLIGFVNGMPLVLVELKAITKPAKDAYDDNLRDYKTTIPQLFWHNAIVILSNGHESRIGTITSEWEHFAEWRRAVSEDEPPAVSLETLIRGVADPVRLLDLVENFTVYSNSQGKPIKLLAKNHQFLGVQRAVAAMDQLGDRQGKLGVFWHTQGSGKSLSMLFFAQKVLRKQPGNWTFVIVTDRDELDDQIHKTFLAAGAVHEADDAHATSAEHLKTLLSGNSRYVFTLIHKFRTEPGHLYPVLSERSDIIVMTDEAHRSQYADFATNMRRALPNASFIAFTGTPLMSGEERTKAVFGDYVSIYNFQQSIDEGATVPLFYENRVPEMQLINPDFDEEMNALLDEAMLDPEQERRLEREFAREYHIITDDDRLERIAHDIVDHYLARYRATADIGGPGKAMVVSVDKATAVRMYDKVHRIWHQRLQALTAEGGVSPSLSQSWEREGAGGRVRVENQPLDPHHRSPLSPEEEGPGMRQFMSTTDMAVVVSAAQNEQADFAAKGLDILPHRIRMSKENLAERFKDPADPFRIVFVTAMWMTGFDVPSLSTLYLDKPLKNHTLMQTIARANRVFEGKTNGLIVDYIGIFRNLEKALAIYAAGSGDMPIQPKEELLVALRAARDKGLAFLEERGVSVLAIHNASGLAKVSLMADAREAIIENDESKLHFLTLAATADAYYRAIQPDPASLEFQGDVHLLKTLAQMIRELTPPADISEIQRKLEALLQRSLASEAYLIQETSEVDLIDLSQIDFQKLADRFQSGRKRTEAERLRARIARTVAYLAELNKSRIDYAERLEQTVADYNAGAINVQLYFEELLKLAQELSEEARRAVSLGLSEEELALFDILTRPGPDLSPSEEKKVLEAARDLLAALKSNKLVLDWRKKQQTKAAVRQTIRRTLARDLRPLYPSDLLAEKNELIYQHIYDAYPSRSDNIYAHAAWPTPAP